MPNKIAVDGRGAVYILGDTEADNFKTTSGAIQDELKGGSDLILQKRDTGDGSIIYSTYLGGRHDDIGSGLAVDSFGSVYITGSTVSQDFPTTPDAYSVAHKGSEDAFAARIRDTGPSGKLSLNRKKHTLKFPYLNFNMRSRNFSVKNAGKGVVSYTVNSDKKWLTVSPLSGDARKEQDKITATVDPLGLKPGTHTGIIRVSSQDAFNSPQQLVFSAVIKGPSIKIKRRNFVATATVGGPNPSAITAKVKNKGPGKLSYKVKSKAAWITATPKNGVSNGEYDNINLTINSNGLEAGTYTGTVEITSKDTVDSPKIITITLKVN